MKRPSFQFYPSDWRDDAGLRLCSIAARGLWVEMMCIMHACERYGHLEVGGKSASSRDLARLTGEDIKTVNRLIAELEANKVFSRDSAGIIYSRRMVRDEVERAKWRDRQDKSRGKTEDVTPVVTPKSPPSTSSPSSPSPKEESTLRVDSAIPKKPARRSLPEGFPFPPDLKWARDYWLPKGRADLCDAMTEEIEKFRDNHTAKATMSACWPGSWRTWCRNAMNWSKKPNGKNDGTQRSNKSGSQVDQHLAGIAEIIREGREGNA